MTQFIILYKAVTQRLQRKTRSRIFKYIVVQTKDEVWTMMPECDSKASQRSHERYTAPTLAQNSAQI